MAGTDRRPDPGTRALERRRSVAMAGHRGDETTARSALGDPDPEVRATALGALRRMGRLGHGTVAAAVSDASPLVRRRAAELAGDPATLIGLTADPDASVVEAACSALGETGGAGRPAVPALARVCAQHPDPRCREAAVAALGAIGDRAALPAILAALSDKPTVRRRAVIALAPFAGAEVEAALERALEDRDWQVRQAAEDLLAT
jgi:HEAT repeat protein